VNVNDPNTRLRPTLSRTTQGTRVVPLRVPESVDSGWLSGTAQGNPHEAHPHPVTGAHDTPTRLNTSPPTPLHRRGDVLLPPLWGGLGRGGCIEAQGGAASKHRAVLHRSTRRCCIEAQIMSYN
jgi:hypothetical protein